MRSFKTTDMEIGLNDKITFGKYKDRTIQELFTNTHRRDIKIRVSYFRWLMQKTQHTLTKEVQKYLQGVKEYYALGWGSMNQDYRPRTDLSCSDNIDGDNPYTFLKP